MILYAAVTAKYINDNIIKKPSYTVYVTKQTNIFLQKEQTKSYYIKQYE